MAFSPAPAQNGTSVTVPLWIDGQEELRQDTFDVFSPVSNDICWNAVAASREDAIRAVETSQEAFKSWSKTKPAVRSEVLLKTAAVLEVNAAEYASYMSTEMGAENFVAQFFVLPLAVQMLKDLAGRSLSITGFVPTVQQEGQSSIVYKEPYGVTLGICPWNAPFVFAIRSAATAIATGNTSILKGSELTPRSYWAIGKAFHEAGLPKGVVNVLSCPPEQAAEIVNTIIEHPAVRKINFTGSAAVGRKVARTCGENLKPCLMELGGKNSAIVLEDADLGLAAQSCIAGSLINAGQICMATDHIIVQSSIAAQFSQILKEGLAKGAGEQPLPRVVSNASKSRLQGLLSQAIDKGASVVFGDGGKETLPGTALIPTVLEGVDQSTDIWDEESFGPVVALTVVGSEEEAVNLANGSRYGLSASVFTKDLRKGLAIAKRLESGAVHINSMTIHDETALPFGGIKNSGWGRFNAEQGMEEFLVTKAVTWDD
ncbi:aldehyde dehydrogenase family protein [Byssothecium circinans]|uniref:Aldehyde dehydrogenase family protein n=1 Tax=Byssothecium circinans TaxID=147558 RepID=A0A6A5UCU5_9PLEO|nr:aldehyde dehydrogenase family protein [Byssothecium circinans]